MKAFTITNGGKIVEGITIHEDNTIHVGEPGRGRKLVRVPLPQNAKIKEDKLIEISSRTYGALILIKDQSGFRGTWKMTGKPLGLCPQADKDIPTWERCPACGEQNHRPTCAPLESLERIGKVIAEGRCAQGAAGRMGGGPEYLIAVPAGTTFGIRRYGRLYGSPADLIVCVEKDNVEIHDALDYFESAEAASLFDEL